MLGVLFVLVVLDDVLSEAVRRHGMEVSGLLVCRGSRLAHPVEWEAVVKVGGSRAFHRGRSYTAAMAVEPLAKAYGVDVSDVSDVSGLTEAATDDERALCDAAALSQYFAETARAGRPILRVSRVLPDGDDPGSYVVALLPLDGAELVSPPRASLRGCVNVLCNVLGVDVVNGNVAPRKGTSPCVPS